MTAAVCAPAASTATAAPPGRSEIASKVGATACASASPTAFVHDVPAVSCGDDATPCSIHMHHIASLNVNGQDLSASPPRVALLSELSLKCLTTSWRCLPLISSQLPSSPHILRVNHGCAAGPA
jgi:hypothetical protein